jgi:hypothetical protein
MASRRSGGCEPPEIHRDHVERRVGERQPQRIAHDEREVGTAHASPFDHRGRDVHAQRVTVPSSMTERRCSACWPAPLEQGDRRTARDLPKTVDNHVQHKDAGAPPAS